MHHSRIGILGSTLLLIMALAGILSGPVALFACNLPEPAKVASISNAGGCCDDAGQPQEDCCEAGCSCACNAPLTARLLLPLPNLTPLLFAATTPQSIPEVYLTIFVPPQNHSRS